MSFITGLWVIPSLEKPVILQVLEQAPNVHRIFAILVANRYMTCIKYDILKCLIDDFCEEELSGELKRFEETFKKYIKRRIDESLLICNQRLDPAEEELDEESDNSLSEEKLLLFTHDIWNPSNTLEDLLLLENKVCDIYGIPNTLVKIRGIIHNCLVLCLLIPSCLKETVTHLRHKQITRLIYFGFTKEQCGDTIHRLEDMCKYRENSYGDTSLAIMYTNLCWTRILLKSNDVECTLNGIIMSN